MGNKKQVLSGLLLTAGILGAGLAEAKTLSTLSPASNVMGCYVEVTNTQLAGYAGFESCVLLQNKAVIYSKHRSWEGAATSVVVKTVDAKFQDQFNGVKFSGNASFYRNDIPCFPFNNQKDSTQSVPLPIEYRSFNGPDYPTKDRSTPVLRSTIKSYFFFNNVVKGITSSMLPNQDDPSSADKAIALIKKECGFTTIGFPKN